MAASVPALGIYVHIPFCVAKCGYCDFASVPLARRARALPRRAPARDRRRPRGRPPRRDRLLRRRDSEPSEAGSWPGFSGPALRVRRGPGAEVSIEANPGTVTPRRRPTSGLSASPGSRWGACSTTRCSRASAAGTRRARRCGVRPVARRRLRQRRRRPDPRAARAARGALAARPRGALALRPEHLSLYALGVEAGTPFTADLVAGRLALRRTSAGRRCCCSRPS